MSYRLSLDEMPAKALRGELARRRELRRHGKCDYCERSVKAHFVYLGLDVDLGAIRGAIDWAQRSVLVYGKVYPQPRLTRWYGDVPYVYSGLTWEAAPMPPLVERIRAKVEEVTEIRFNSVLCNLYRNGQDSVGWHADNEPIFGGDPVVASVSFGAERVFKLRKNDKSEEHRFFLTHGSLFVMGKGIQTEWQHCLPRTAKRVGERVNLTFRQTV